MTMALVSDHEYAPGRRGVLALPATPASERAAGVLVLHGGAGPGAHERERATRLADAGLVAFAPDLFGVTFRDRAHGIEVITALVEAPATLRARVAEAVRWLRARPEVDAARVSVVGFCFGGLAALELARAGEDLAHAICIHGGLHTRAPAAPGAVRARVLVCTGAADPFVTRAHRDALDDELTRAGARWDLHLYGGVAHGFSEKRPTPLPGCAYDAHADAASWRATLDALATT